MPAKDQVQSVKRTGEKNRLKESDLQKANDLNPQYDLAQIGSYAGLPSASYSPDDILCLQRSIGNQAVNRLLAEPYRSTSPSQSKLSQLPFPSTHLIQRVVPGDFTRTTVPEFWVWKLTDQELMEQTLLLEDQLQKFTSSGPELNTLMRNRQLLETEKNKRSSPGLTVAGQARGVADATFVFWTSTDNKDKPLKELGEAILSEANELIPHPCQSAYAESASSGSFSQADWTITINTKIFSERSGITKVGQLNKDEVADIVDTIYHEARHSEQAFHIAQMKAGQGKSAKTIEAEMSIPPLVAEHAYNSPFKGSSKAEKKLIAEAKSWDDITARYNEYENWLQDEKVDELKNVFKEKITASAKIGKLAPLINTMGTTITDVFGAAVTRIKAIDKIRRNKLDRNVLMHSKAIRKNFNLLKIEFNKQNGHPKKYNLPRLKKLVQLLWDAQYNAYMDIEYEKDAYKVGPMAGEAFRKKKVKGRKK